MNEVLSQLPFWLTGLMVGVTIVRLVTAIMGIIIYGRTTKLHNESKRGIVIWVSSVLLLNALFQRVRNVPTGELGSAYLVPAIYVPALFVSHYIIFRLLAMPKEGYDNPITSNGD